MERNMENRYDNEEFAELVKIVEASGYECAVILLKYLLNPEIFEVFDDMEGSTVDYSPITEVVLSSGSEKALDILVSLLTEQQYSEPLTDILETVVEKKVSSTSDLKRIGEIIKKAISEAYAHGDMYGDKHLR